MLFVLGGLIFSYGLRHGPPDRMCTEHAFSVPVAAVSAAGDQKPGAAASALHDLHRAADTALSAPAKDRPPLDACLCVAVLYSLVLLGLAAVARRPASRLPARAGWTLAPPDGRTSRPVFRPPLLVLRL
ncbi:hypothetical protein D0T12_33600 [Actinomadura spongiicola]|uniref:Uncharacterized protein n=1 Tax=Actinomadura spongiicola TaxID=2303421 RepID=A0A372G6S7_9ACTN|nr:hypothetical protein [Actinomadura spongiicola]RFS81100.1 hypothetical protein D0T12_33600 [Actinomadura spongiicola]